jgi:hypothetical protein
MAPAAGGRRLRAGLPRGFPSAASPGATITDKVKTSPRYCQESRKPPPARERRARRRPGDCAERPRWKPLLTPRRKLRLTCSTPPGTAGGTAGGPPRDTRAVTGRPCREAPASNRAPRNRRVPGREAGRPGPADGGCRPRRSRGGPGFCWASGYTGRGPRGEAYAGQVSGAGMAVRRQYVITPSRRFCDAGTYPARLPARPAPVVAAAAALRRGAGPAAGRSQDGPGRGFRSPCRGRPGPGGRGTPACATR